MKHLILLCGIPASGKSTFAHKCIERATDKVVYISRDEVRFSIVKEDEEYFSHENEVFKTFINKINEALADETISAIYVDATHINERSRNKTLDALNLKDVIITVIDFDEPVEVCLERNENREGRAYVPKSAIRRMSAQKEKPSMCERYQYNTIFTVRNGEVIL